MRRLRLYPIAHFENFSPDTLKMTDILRYGLRCSKVCLRGYTMGYIFFSDANIK